jgi:hypothetical protein
MITWPGTPLVDRNIKMNHKGTIYEKVGELYLS